MQKAAELDASFTSALVDFGNALATAGRFDEALHSAKRALPLIPNQPTAYEAGWKDPRMARLLPMWVPLRGDPRFEQLVARMEADVAAMRARADYSGLP